jgi:hypothetical protein
VHLLHSALTVLRHGGVSAAVAITLATEALAVLPAHGQDTSTAAGAVSTTLTREERIRALENRPWDIRAARVKVGDVQIEAIFNDEGSPGDVMNIVIDAYHAHRNALQFSTNANGVLHDWLQMGETAATRDDNFDTVWNAKGRRLPYGYEIEVAIPFTSLRFEAQPSGEEVIFGIGFRRNIPRKNEEAIWPYVSPDSDWQRPAEYGHLRGLVDVRPGRNLEVRPYVLGGTHPRHAVLNRQAP